MIVWLLACVREVPEPVEKAQAPCAACVGECTLEVEPATSKTHVEGEVDYPSYPPSSGDHNPCWAPWGVHTEVVQPENWVHNLEHGGVVFLYTAELPAEDLASLTAYVQSLPQGRALLTPASDPMDAVVAVVSWQHRLLLGCYDAAMIEDFFWTNVSNAPEDVTSDPGTCAMDDDTGGDTGDTGDTGAR